MLCRLHFRSSQTESYDEYSPVFARVVVCGYFLTVLFYFWGFERLFPQVDPGSVLGPRMGLTFCLWLAVPGVVLFLFLLSEGLFCAEELFLRHYAWLYSRFGVGVPPNLRATEGKASLRPQTVHLDNVRTMAVSTYKRQLKGTNSCEAAAIVSDGRTQRARSDSPKG